MADEPIRLGGMALTNGVLVHGPRSWACAIRLPDGRLEVAAELKRFRASEVTNPLFRGPARLAEAISLLPIARRRLSGMKHIAIGTYEHGEARDKEHERCGSHLVGPLLGSLMIGNVLASRAPRQFRLAARGLASLAAVAVSTEIFSWMIRNPDHPLSKALAKPGHELQHRLATAEPTPEQLEVAEAALAACLALEDGHR